MDTLTLLQEESRSPARSCIRAPRFQFLRFQAAMCPPVTGRSAVPYSSHEASPAMPCKAAPQAKPQAETLLDTTRS